MVPCLDGGIYVLADGRSFQLILTLILLRTKFRIRIRQHLPRGLYQLKVVLAGCSDKLCYGLLRKAYIQIRIRTEVSYGKTFTRRRGTTYIHNYNQAGRYILN